jgi:hypothetical protein
MTTKRYKAYLAAKRFLKSVVGLGKEERALLVDIAEGLLLVRPGEEHEASELTIAADLALNRLELMRQLDIERGQELRTLLLRCGPSRQPVKAVHRRPAFVASNGDASGIAFNDADERTHTHRGPAAG